LKTIFAKFAKNTRTFYRKPHAMHLAFSCFVRIFTVLKLKCLKIMTKVDWVKMGFKSEKEYNDFLEVKLQQFLLKLKEPKIKVVFDRLKDR
jgi:hypothetical protein